jgi:hypothetical protein
LTKQKPTGNPVFEFRADFRKSAEKLQHRLLFSGLVLFAACGIATLFADISPRLRLYTSIGSLCGLIFFAGSLFWGFYWRKKLRDDFRETYKL